MLNLGKNFIHDEESRRLLVHQEISQGSVNDNYQRIIMKPIIVDFSVLEVVFEVSKFEEIK